MQGTYLVLSNVGSCCGSHYHVASIQGAFDLDAPYRSTSRQATCKLSRAEFSHKSVPLACLYSACCCSGLTWSTVQGHKIKNPKTVIAQQLRSIPTVMAVIISGTPVQNNLMEMHALFDFVQPVRPSIRARLLPKLVGDACWWPFFLPTHILSTSWDFTVL